MITALGLFAPVINKLDDVIKNYETRIKPAVAAIVPHGVGTSHYCTRWLFNEIEYTNKNLHAMFFIAMLTIDSRLILKGVNTWIFHRFFVVCIYLSDELASRERFHLVFNIWVLLPLSDNLIYFDDIIAAQEERERIANEEARKRRKEGPTNTADKAEHSLAIKKLEERFEWYLLFILLSLSAWIFYDVDEIFR
jgi:hypothetical protein